MIADNDWYGHKRALNDYCGVPSDRHIYGLISHGWAPDHPAGNGHRTLSFAPYFVWNDNLLQEARGQGVPNVRCVGAPFIYLFQSAYREVRQSPGAGTLLMPAHSAEGTISYVAEEFIDAVKSQMPGPYTVSVYFQDLDSEIVDVYRAAGLRVVSFGRRMRQEFLGDMAGEIAAHSAVVSNVVQTSIWYGALMGRRVLILGREAFPVEPGQRAESARGRWPQLFEAGASVEETTALAEQELGFANLRTPEQLRSELGLDSLWKRATASRVRRAVDWRLARKERKRGFRIDGLEGSARN